MNKKLKKEIKEFLKKEFADKIKKKLIDGHSLSKFKVNPMVLMALSSGVLGEVTAENMAKVLLFPRVFGTSTSTTFGSKMQKLCVHHLEARASGTDGMDIEFKDKVEGGEIILQLKAGPNTINAGDVNSILREMRHAYRLIQRNDAVEMPTFALGVTYGDIGDVSSHYRNIQTAGVGAQPEIPLYVGVDFWHRLTGRQSFYRELISLFIDLFEEEDYSDLLKKDLEDLETSIEGEYFTDGVFDPTKL